MSNTTGGQNVAIGIDALLDNTTGGQNIAIGIDALLANSIGNNNTAIGANAGNIITTGSRNTVIGAGANVPNPIANNQISIGNLIYATGASGGGVGNVGIGTDAPTNAKLHVSGNQSSDNGNYGYLANSATTGTGSGANPYSIYASDRVAAAEFNAFSDARIKRIKGLSNTAHDLATLAQIRITNYTHIDEVSKGNREVKKVIAQEVKEIYPQAVSLITDAIPDIYKTAEMNTEGTITIANTLKVGEKVKLIFATGEEILEVKEANAQSFKVASTKAGKVFVFGREVSDFHVVDYEALGTLNISATQELLKRIQALETENQTLKTQVNELGALKAEVEKIKQALQIEASGKK